MIFKVWLADIYVREWLRLSFPLEWKNFDSPTAVTRSFSHSGSFSLPLTLVVSPLLLLFILARLFFIFPFTFSSFPSTSHIPYSPMLPPPLFILSFLSSCFLHKKILWNHNRVIYSTKKACKYFVASSMIIVFETF